MTKDEVIVAVQAQLNDYTDPFKQRIDDSVAFGIATFCSECQWEFLDVYASLVTALDSTSGKYKIVASGTTKMPADFFKPVIFYAGQGQILYQNRNEWGDTQAFGGATAVTPTRYTVIGSDYFLDRPSGSTTIYAVYTRTSDNVKLEDMPAQYHPAIVQAVSMWLTPAILGAGQDRMVPNPAYDAAKVRYEKEISKAQGFEVSIKGRPRKFKTPELLTMRNRYR